VADRAHPVAVVDHTVIGKGVSFMEGKAEFHGRGLTEEEYHRAMAELGLAPALEAARSARPGPVTTRSVDTTPRSVSIETGSPREYGPDAATDNRSAWGAALVDIAAADPAAPIAVLDCDLAASVKTEAFARAHPGRFVQCGVGEHNAATVAGALSVSGVLTFFSDFGVFGIDEVYNQQRLNDINHASVKLVVTHCGIDVGEDGKTHQCLDYVGAFRSMFGWKVIVPADPNQTDRAVRAAVALPGCVAIAVGRSKARVILNEDGSPLFGVDYAFEYGRADWARHGSDGVIVTMGTVAGAAVDAADALRAEGIDVGVCIVSCPLDPDPDAFARIFAAPWALVCEDHGRRTGLWASLAEWGAREGRSTRLASLGVSGYQGSGDAASLLKVCGLDAQGIARHARSLAVGAI
jgi:transketolase